MSVNIAMVACGQFVASILDGIFGGDQKNGWRLVLGCLLTHLLFVPNMLYAQMHSSIGRALDWISGGQLFLLDTLRVLDIAHV